MRTPSARSGAAPAPPFAQLRELRAALAGRACWVVATDHPPAADACRALAGLLTLFGGAAPGQVVLCEFDAHVLDRAERVAVTAVAVAKALLPAAGAAEFVAGLTGGDPRALLARVRSGRDVLPVSADPLRLGLILDRIHGGRLAPADPSAN